MIEYRKNVEINEDIEIGNNDLHAIALIEDELQRYADAGVIVFN